jgi:hypothetical protein
MPGVIQGPTLVSGAKFPLATLEQTSASRIKALEAAIQADPFDIQAWDGRLQEAARDGKAVLVFERAVKQFPTSARIWTAYAEWCENQDTPLALSVYKRCCRQVPSLDLWLSRLTFYKRHQPLEEIFRSYADTVDLLGTDSRAGGVWMEYIALLKRAYNAVQKKTNPDAEVSGRLLQEDANPIEAARRTMKPALKKRVEESKAHDISEDAFLRVAETLQVDILMLRTAFQRAVSSAHASLDKVWVGYEQFEKSLGNPPLAAKLLGDYMPRYLRGKNAYKELQHLFIGVDYFAMATPIRSNDPRGANQHKLHAKWKAVIRFERTNPLRHSRVELQARVTLLSNKRHWRAPSMPSSGTISRTGSTWVVSLRRPLLVYGRPSRGSCRRT